MPNRQESVAIKQLKYELLKFYTEIILFIEKDEKSTTAFKYRLLAVKITIL